MVRKFALFLILNFILLHTTNVFSEQPIPKGIAVKSKNDVKTDNLLASFPAGCTPQEIGLRVAGDFHGQAPVLWSANALLR